MAAHELGRLFFNLVTCPSCGATLILKQLGLTPVPLLKWWIGGYVDGCFNSIFFPLRCRFPYPFLTFGQTGWAPLIFNEKNRKYVVPTENALAHFSPPPLLPFTKSFADWAVCSFLTMFLLHVRDFLILLWLGLHFLPHCSKECL